MAGINTVIQIQDRMSQPLMNMNSALSAVISSFHDMQDLTGSSVNAESVSNMREELSRAETAVSEMNMVFEDTKQYIQNNVDKQEDFNDSVKEGASQSDDLMNSIKGAVAAYVSMQTVSKALSISDELTQTTARLDMMNDGLQSTDDLVNMVYAAAQDARGSLSEMADVVARFGNNAKDAFSSNEEVVAFADLIQKQMTIAGASTSEASNAMLQLSQALGSGVLRGDELNSIFEQAPNLIQSIADYLDVPIGQIRQMASDGELSADVVKAAIFASSDDINSKFESMPMTWGQVWTSIQNTAIMAFKPVLQRINDLANSDVFQNVVNNVINAMAVAANIVLNIFNLVASVGNFIADNWSIISPVIYGVITALALYLTYLGVTKAAEIISTGVKIAMCVAEYAHAAATGTAVAATTAETAAQLGLNSALLACPITWIILAVIALIVIIFTVCNAIAKLTGVTQSGFGIICGVVVTAGAFIGNIFIGLLNRIIGIGIEFYNLIATFANFFVNVFNDPVGAIINLFAGMFDFILGIVQSSAKLIDTVLGSDLSGAVAGFRSDVADKVAGIVGEQTIVMSKLNASDYQLSRLDYGEAFDAGDSFGDGIAKKVSDFSLDDIFGSTDIPGTDSFSFDSSDSSSNLESIADDTGSIADSLEIASEDLKYLLDIAERDVINKFTTADIKVEVGGIQQTVSSNQDLDGIVNYMTEKVEEQLRITAEAYTFEGV